MTTTPANPERRRTARTLTEAQWFAKADCHVRWRAAWRAELATLESRVDESKSVQTVQRIIDRIDAIELRANRLKRVMALHVERAPAELLPKVLHALDVKVQ